MSTLLLLVASKCFIPIFGLLDNQREVPHLICSEMQISMGSSISFGRVYIYYDSAGREGISVDTKDDAIYSLAHDFIWISSPGRRHNLRVHSSMHAFCLVVVLFWYISIYR